MVYSSVLAWLFEIFADDFLAIDEIGGFFLGVWALGVRGVWAFVLIFLTWLLRHNGCTFPLSSIHGCSATRDAIFLCQLSWLAPPQGMQFL